MVIEPSDFLEKFTDHQLNRRIINVLSGLDIYTIGDFVRYFGGEYDVKIQSLRGIGNDSIAKLKDFIDLLISRGFIFLDNVKVNSTNSPINNYPNISENLVGMKLIAFPNILSKRTTNALSKIGIEIVSDVFDKIGKISSMMIDGLGKKGYAEIEQLIRYLKDQSLPMEHKMQDIDLLSLIEDLRLVNVLKYNLITKVSHLSEYVSGVNDWGNIRYIKDEDTVLLIDIYAKYNVPKIQKKQTIADAFLGHFSDIDKDIIQERILGEMSLEQMGMKLGLTRERVRQKQKDIENRISEIGKSVIESDEHLSKNITSIVNNYGFILLPKQSYLFDFLGFSEQDFPLLFLMLSGLNGLRGEYLEKYRLYTVFSHSVLLSGDSLRDIYNFLMKRLEKNNEDLNIDDIAYEYILDDKVDNAKQIKITSKIKGSSLINEKNKIKYESTKGGAYELILED